MKILQVNSVYKKGSTGKIVFDIYNVLLQNKISSIVCYGRGQKEHENNVYKISLEILAKFNAFKSRLFGLQYGGSWLATLKLIKIIRNENPDVVHLHCINGYFVNIYMLLHYLKKNNIRTVLTLHAEFMYTGSCGHSYECEKWKTGCGNCPQLWVAAKSYWFDRTDSAWLKMKEAMKGFNNIEIIAVSKWLENRAKCSPIINQYPISVIHNGVDTDNIFKPTNYRNLKNKHGLKNEKIILFVTASFSLRDNDIKGGRYVVQLADRLKNINVKIIVIGGRDLSLKLPNNILNIGCINNQNELAAYYSMADLVLITSRRETYSMVCAESLSCGTPVVGFKSGGPESIAIPEFSEFVDYGDIYQLERVVVKWLNVKDNISANIIVNKAHQIYSRKMMCLEYLKVYNELIRNE